MSDRSGTLATHSQARKLADPADFQRPLMHYAGLIKQHLWLMAGVSAALTALVVVVCLFIPEINAGSSVIAVDRQSQPESVGDDRMLATGDDQFMATQLNLLQADTVLRPVAERYHLLEREHQLRRYFFWRYSPEKEQAIRDAPIQLKKLKIQREPNTYLLTITYKNSDPKVAADVANAIADSYLQNIFSTRVREAGRLTSSMEQQLIDLKDKMETSHLALMKYQKDLGTADPEQKTSVLVAKLQALNTEYSAAEGDRISKEAVYRAAREGTLPAVQVSAQATDLAKDVQAAQAARANLALAAATYGDQHPEYRKAAAQLKDAQEAVDESRKNVSARIQIDYRQAANRERMLGQAVTDTKHDVDDLTARSFEYMRLKHEADAAERVYEDLFAKIKQAGINSELQNNVIRLADPARPAAKPLFPNWTMIVPLSLIFFGMVSAGYFISRDLTDETAKDPLLVQESLGVRVICTLPKVSDAHLRLSRPTPNLLPIGNHQPSLDSGFFFEGVRHLRSYMALAPEANDHTSVLVTSALPGDGKSTIALSLAIAHAERGKRTLLVDADLRQSTLEKLLQMDRHPGIADLLAGKREWTGLVRSVPGSPNLFILGSGTAMPLPLSLLGPRIGEILDRANKEFEFVVVDSPPILGCAETLDLAVATDATLVAARSGQTSMKSLEAVVDTLRRVNVRIAGIVLNQSTMIPDKTYKAYRRYYTALRSA